MRFGLLGTVQVVGDLGEERQVPAPKHRILLAALLLNANRPVSREALIDVLWGEAPPPNAAAAVRTYLARLRQVLADAGERITAGPSGLEIEVRSAAEFDVHAAEDLHARGLAAARTAQWPRTSALLREAEGLWRGHPLADVPSEVLLRREVPRLEELRLSVTGLRIDAELSLGRANDLVGELRTLVAAHPLREHTHAQLMLALYQAQRRGEALAAYQDARKVLREQLGADPTEQLQLLHQQILSGEPAPELAVHAVGARQPKRKRSEPEAAASAGSVTVGRSVGESVGKSAATAATAAVTTAPTAAGVGPKSGLVPHLPRQLPMPPRGFAGRAAELRLLDELADEAGAGTVEIAAVSGTAGVGKTALALHWAHRNAARFPDGQLYVNLRGFDPGEQPVPPELALRDCLAALGVPGERIPAALEARSALYRSLLAGRRVLVVLDNARDVQQVRPLLPADPGCLALVTSRSDLRGLVIAEGARPLPLPLMDVAEASELLARKLGAARVGGDPAATGELIDRCARLPLALSIAAAHIDSRRHTTVRSFAEDLRSAATSLDVLGVDDPLTDLRTVLSCSLRALSTHGARTFRLLGLAPGRDFSAAAVAALTDLEPALADRAIGELVDANLLDELTAGRYSFHDLLRACARELAGQVDPAVADEARGRLFGWYVHAAYAADAALDYRDRRYRPGPVPKPRQMPVFAGHEQAEAWFTAEHENIADVVAAAAERAADSAAWDLAIIPWNFYHRHSLNDEWLRVLQIALKAVRERESGTRGEQTVLNMLGLCHRRRGELPQAVDAYEKCIAIARTLEGVHLLVLLNNLAMAYLYSGRERDALTCLEEALAVAGADDAEEAHSVKVLNNMGEAHRHLGQFEQALPYLERGLALAEKYADPAAVYLLATLGETHLSLARFHEAAEYCGQGLNMLQGMEYPSVVAKLLADQGSARHALGDDAGARSSWEEALDIYERLDAPEAADLRARLAELR